MVVGNVVENYTLPNENYVLKIFVQISKYNKVRLAKYEIVFIATSRRLTYLLLSPGGRD